MTNDVQVFDNKGNAINLADINRSVKITNEYRRLTIYTKMGKRKDNGKPFKSIKAQMYLDYYDKDGNYKGKKNLSVNVSFKMNAFDDCMADGIKREDDLTTGYLYVLAKSLQAPHVYKQRLNESTGKMEYPKIWIKGGIVGFEPQVVEQDAFEYHDDKRVVVDEETGEVTELVEDNDEVEETTLE